MKKFLKIFSFIICLAALFYWTIPTQSDTGNTLEKIKKRGFLLWGSDAEGGAPYAFPDPKDPSRLIGFEVDLAEAIARELGVKARQSQNAWDSLIPALKRGDFDMVMNGIEITPQRQAEVLFSLPYYIYTEQLVVRKEETKTKDINDLKGKKVGTLSGAVAQDILTNLGGVDVRVYSGQVEPYEDLALGRLDAVLLDLPIAAYYAKPNPKLKYTGNPVGEGFYGIAIRKDDDELKKKIDEILIKLLKSGELKKIYEKWDLWNDTQEKLFKVAKESKDYVTLEETRKAPIYTFFPNLLRGAGITILISFSSMALAIVLGLIITILRLYGRPPLSTA
ncbi:transporter substrate-binding domain-containing protein, partial [Dissulfurispira sp.]|uniref:transporter substrate-binding domain-containing protein n=1 Tax=Dissulfurispira sp. TaxID=2817609 RepID=UPI002FD9B5B6